jgi:cyclic pyranopterin phosphate synthase
LRNVGLNHLNISLDALDHQRYAEITHGSLAPVLAGIRMAKSLGFESIKLNTVLIRHKTEDQIWSLVEFAASLQIPIRFIELMPIGRPQMANEENLLSVGEVMQLLALKETLEPVEPPPGHGPARYYRLPRTGATVGFIGACSDPHSGHANNKMRLTTDGKLRPCLDNRGEYDLKPALRPALDRFALRASLDRALAF